MSIFDKFLVRFGKKEAEDLPEENNKSKSSGTGINVVRNDQESFLGIIDELAARQNAGSAHHPGTQSVDLSTAIPENYPGLELNEQTGKKIDELKGLNLPIDIIAIAIYNVSYHRF
jgi:hypothetical protein